MSKDKDDRSDWWPCACVKRDKGDNLSHIKLHKPSVKACPACKCKRVNMADVTEQNRK